MPEMKKKDIYLKGRDPGEEGRRERSSTHCFASQFLTMTEPKPGICAMWVQGPTHSGHLPLFFPGRQPLGLELIPIVLILAAPEFLK